MRFVIDILIGNESHDKIKLTQRNIETALFLVYNDKTKEQKYFRYNRLLGTKLPFGFTDRYAYKIDIDTVRLLEHITDIKFHKPDRNGDFDYVFEDKYKKFVWDSMRSSKPVTYKSYDTDKGIIYIYRYLYYEKYCIYGTVFYNFDWDSDELVSLAEVLRQVEGVVPLTGSPIYLELGNEENRELCEITFEPSFMTYWIKYKVLRR